MPRKKSTQGKKEKDQTKKGGISADIYNTKGEVVEEISLSKEVFGAKINSALLAQAVRVYLANQRLGTHKTKTRSEVIGSTRKIYRQKGTGRARHGDIKAPIFAGGGVAHGPKPRDYSLELPSKMKRLTLCGALSDKFQQGKVKIISELSKTPPKTSELLKVLQNLNLVDDKDKVADTILVTPARLENVFLAGRNLENLEITTSSLLNTYEVMKVKNLLFLKEAITKIEERLISKKKSG